MIKGVHLKCNISLFSTYFAVLWLHICHFAFEINCFYSEPVRSVVTAPPMDVTVRRNAILLYSMLTPY